MVQDNFMSPKFPQATSLPTEYVCVEVYTVRTGDTLYSISQRSGVPVPVLMEANRILNPYNLRYGQKICIPGLQSDCPEPSEDSREWKYETSCPEREMSPCDDMAPCPREEPLMYPEEEIPPMSLPTPIPAPAPAPVPPMPMPTPVAEPVPSMPMPMPTPLPAPVPPMPMPMPTPILAPAPAPAPAPVPPMPMPTPVCVGMLHTIKAGDTLYMLAKQHNIPLEDILNANPGVNPYNLQIGQKICIPATMTMPIEQEPVCRGIIHTVKSGDTLYMLAKQYKLTLDEIMNANPQIDCYMLQVGMRLCIPTARSQSEAWFSRVPAPSIPSMPAMPTPSMPAMPTPSMPTMPTPTVPTVPMTPARPTTPSPGMPAMPTPAVPSPTRPTAPAPTAPTMPTPSMPTMPTPTVPTVPTTPARPTTPSPGMPTMPAAPIMPTIPTIPTIPTTPAMPTAPTAPTMPTMPGQQPAQQPGDTPAETPEETPDCTGFMHTVRAGDSLYMLARQYKITLDALMRANPNLDPYNLRIGMQLCIPIQGNGNNMNGSQRNQMAGETAGSMDQNGRVYRTQRGDTLTRILDRYEITFAALKSSNPKIDFTDSLDEISLIIPSEDNYRTCPMSGAYIVKSGDSLDSISKKLLVITDGLLMANPTLTTEDFSIPGTKVCIPN